MWAVLDSKKINSIYLRMIWDHLGSEPKMFIPKLKIKRIIRKRIIHETSFYTW